MKLINCTPHVINILSADGSVNLGIPPSGTIARAASRREVIDEMEHGDMKIPLARVTLGAIEGLPDPEPDTRYIVSALAGLAAKVAGRTDVLLVDDAVRDGENRIIGCRAFALP